MHTFTDKPPREGAHVEDPLRLIACGSVDAGKSTLIERLLRNSKLISDDQLASLPKDPGQHGTIRDDIDLPLLPEGLEVEHKKSMTIDVAYRFFTAANRSFIVADTSGQEQYTRSIATGASDAQLAIILIDARKGVLVQTRRDSLICSLLRVSHVIVAVNKVDLIGFNRGTFESIASEYAAFAMELGFKSIVSIPISAQYGDNVSEVSGNTPWYSGPTLLQQLERTDVEGGTEGLPLRFPVQRVNSDVCGYAGSVASGTINVGDNVVVAATGHSSRVKEILPREGANASASAGDAITLTLADELDISRGDMLVSPRARPEVSEQFAAHIIWMSDEPLVPSRTYLARIGTKTVETSITALKYKIDVNTREHLAAHTLELDDIGFCNLATSKPVAFDAYDKNRLTGSFIIVDRLTSRTMGVGMIAFGLRRGENVHWQPLTIGKVERSALKRQRPTILWFTGLSGAGKSTIANIVEQRLHVVGYHTTLLDGDNVRHGLCRDLGFTEADRVENIRRAGEVAKLMVESGLIVICSFISPYRSERDMIRNLVDPNEFIEVFVDTSLEECIRRDPKGLYAKAKSGQIKNFTGFDSPYERPTGPEVHLETSGFEPIQLADTIISALINRGIIDKP